MNKKNLWLANDIAYIIVETDEDDPEIIAKIDDELIDVVGPYRVRVKFKDGEDNESEI